MNHHATLSLLARAHRVLERVYDEARLEPDLKARVLDLLTGIDIHLDHETRSCPVDGWPPPGEPF